MTGILNLLMGTVRSAGVTADPYFEYTTLLLPGSGTNGTQNNSFVDSSANAFPITRNPLTGPNAPTQGTFSPFSQTGWGNYFNGTNAYLRAGSAANWAFLSNTTAAWTVEFWVYNTTSGSATTFFDTSNSTTANVGITIQKTSSEYVNVQIYYASAGNFIVNGTSTSTLTANTWNHVFISYSQSLSSSNLVFYINGVAAGTANKTGNTPSSSNPFGALSIGTYGAGGGQFFAGYLSNVRISNVVRTPPSSVPTSPYTSDADTQLLTCQSNRFVDNSTVSTKTITPSGSPSVQAFSPFNPTASWSAATNGGSGYFDGSGDYLSFTPGSSFAFGTGDFTVEAWFYPTQARSGGIVSPASNGSYWDLLINSNNGIQYQSAAGITNKLVTANNVFTLFAWNHIALVRNSGTSVIYVNGVSVGSVADTVNYTATINYAVGRNSDGYFSLGYFNSVRVIKGTAVYTGAFTPPTAPITDAGSTSAASYPSTTNVNTSFASSATSLLLNFTNAGVYDATSKNDLETVADAQISTAINNPFGASTGTIKFDGTGDILLLPSTPLLYLSSSPFTIECWVYPLAQNGGIISRRSSVAPRGFILAYGNVTTNKFTFLAGDTSTASWEVNISSTNTFTTGSWYYVVITRNASSVFTLYVNGNVEATATPSSFVIADDTSTLNIGGVDNTGQLNGYLSNLRVTGGYARTITASPTAAFPTL